MTANHEIKIQVFAPGFRSRAILGYSPLQHIEEYTIYAGRMKPIPSWLLSGPVIGYEGGTQKVLDLYAKLTNNNIKPTAFWLQDWSGLRIDTFGKRLWWNWEVDDDNYPGWDSLCHNLSQAGTKMLTYINPYLADTVSKDKKSFKRDLYKEAASLGYLVQKQNGDPYILASGSSSFTFGMVDFTNPAAAAWYSKVITDNMLGRSQMGWMADFGEYLPFDAKLHNGNPLEQHNLYPEHWAEANQIGVANSETHDAVFFMRASHTRSPAYSTLFWLGDQLVTWDEHDGLKSVIDGHLSAGLSGMSLMHSDIGGYTMINEFHLNYTRSQELLLRWAEMSAVSDVVFRTHPGNLPDSSFQIWTDDWTMQCFAHMVQIHDLFVPYRIKLMQNATKQGHPLVRAMWLHWPDDTTAQDIGQQFMLGPDFLIAPALEAQVTEVSAYLPQGEWTYAWNTSHTHTAPGQGLNVTVQAPLGTPAIFYVSTSADGAAVSKGLHGLDAKACAK